MSEATATTTPVPSTPEKSDFLSPINQRRLANFKANRRGLWSFWLFIFLFGLSLCAELIANDRPLLVRVDGHSFYPILFDYPETAFGGEFETNADYRDPYFKELITEKGGSVFWPPIRYSFNTRNLDVPVPAPSPPTWMLTDEQCKATAQKVGGTGCRDIEWNWLGTDDNARDILARIIYGFRISVIFALTLTGISTILGIMSGAVQGYFGGWVDLIGQRIIEIWSSVPALYILIILSAVFAPGFWVLLGTLLLFSWTSVVSYVRAEFLRARNLEYVRAARALGVGNITIMWKHMLPNAMVATLTFLPFLMSGAISTMTALDYLGFGMPAGSPSLGEMLQQARNNLQAPWIGITIFLTLTLMLSLLVFIGEAVRDAFDPRKTFN